MAGDALTDLLIKTARNDGVLAGLIMGEGCIDYHSTPRIRVKMADRPVVDWIQERYGGTSKPVVASTGRWMWEWYIGGSACLVLCERLIPLLIGSKARQADLLLIMSTFPAASATRKRLRAELSELKRISYAPDTAIGR